MKLINAASILLLAGSLSGCVVAIGNDGWDDEDGWKARQERNARYIRGLDMGKTRALVEADLGTPDFSESFQRDGDTFQVLYYRTHQHSEDGRTSKAETTPLVFIDESLVGWGETAIEKATR